MKLLRPLTSRPLAGLLALLLPCCAPADVPGMLPWVDEAQEPADGDLLWHPQQDVDVEVGTAELDGGALELWSEGSAAEDAGAGVQLTLDPQGVPQAWLRRGRGRIQVQPLGAPGTVGAAGRLRVRMRKEAGARSLLHVDRSDPAAHQADVAVFAIEDDHLLIGRHVRLVRGEAPPRELGRERLRAFAPSAPLLLLRSFDGLADWKLFQRGPEGTAVVPVPFAYRSSGWARLSVRGLRSEGAELPGTARSFLLAPAPEGRRALVEVTLPQGGNYRLSALLAAAPGGAQLGEDEVGELAVGDVYLAAGQSNMSGDSGELEPAEAPTPQVHRFGNDYAWKLAREPMDDGTDQVDRVSEEAPQHSLMLRFGKEVAAATGVPVALVPASEYATDLAAWRRSPERPADRGTLFGSAVHRVSCQGYRAPIAGVLWYQGESDAGRSPQEYRQDLAALLGELRADLGGQEIFFASVQLATYDPGGEDSFSPEDWLAIQEAQRQGIAEASRAALVAAAGLPRADAKHLTMASQKELGALLGRAVLRGAYRLPVKTGPGLVAVRAIDEDGDGDGAAERIEVQYDRAVIGGAPDLYRVKDARGEIAVRAVRSEGGKLALALARGAGADVTLSYGGGASAEAAWVRAEDGGGDALLFQRRPASRSPTLAPLPGNYGVATPEAEAAWLADHQSWRDSLQETGADVLFLGDSITRGWVGLGNVPPQRTWQSYYADQRGAVDLGFSAERIEHLLWRVEHGAISSAHPPRLVVVLIGTNNLVPTADRRRSTTPPYQVPADAPDEIAAGIGSLVGRLRVLAPGARVLLLGLLPREREAAHPLRAQIRSINGQLAGLDDGTFVRFLDLGALFLLPDGTLASALMSDFLHPSPAGYAHLAHAMNGLFDELLAPGGGYRLAAATTPRAGAPFALRWSATAGDIDRTGDWAGLYRPGADTAHDLGRLALSNGAYAEAGTTAGALSVPYPGSYELRYFKNGGDHQVLTTMLEVLP